MTTTVEAPRKVEQTEAQNELRGLLAAALTAVKEKNRKNLMTYLALAMAKSDEL